MDALSDQVQVFVPWLRFAADALRTDGRLPLWKDTAGAGAPLLGNGQSSLFYPTHLLALLLGAPPVVLGLQALLKFVAGAFGAWLLARHLRASVAASILCGLVFGFGGFQAAWNLFPLTSVSLLLPLLVLTADRLVLAPSAARLTLLAAVAALQHLGGHPETAFHSQVLVMALGLARVLSLRVTAGSRAAWTRLGWLALGLCAGAALAAIQVLPLLEYLSCSELLERRIGEAAATPAAASAAGAAGATEGALWDTLWPRLGFGVALVTAWLALRRLASERHLASERRPSLAPSALAALALGVATFGGVLAGLAGGLSPGFLLVLVPDWLGPPTHYFGPQYFVEQAGAFVGAAFPLAMLGALAGTPRGVVRVAGGVAAAGLLAGYHAPLVDDLLAWLPPFSLALNERLQLVALLALALLAALGLDSLGALQRPGARARWMLATGVPPLAAFGALALSVQLGWITSDNVPPRNQGTSLIEAHLLPAAKVAPQFAEDPPLGGTAGAGGAAGAADGKLMCGYLVAPRAASAIAVLFGRDGHAAPTQWKPASPGRESRHVYVFRALVPTGDQPRETTRVRVQVQMQDDSLAVSARLISPEDEPGALPFPALPLAGGSTALMLGLSAGVIALVLLPSSVRGPGRGLACLTLVAAGVLSFAHSLVPLVPAALFYPRAPLIDALAQARPDGRIVIAQPGLLGAEIPTFYGLLDARGYDALQPARVARLFDEATRDPRHLDLPLLGLMAVRLIGDPDAARRRPDDPRAGVTENPHALPRARLVGGAEVETDDARALARLRDPTFPRATTALLASGTPRTAPPGDVGRATIRSSRPDQVTVEIEPAAAGWLLLADTDFPGWTARVDGEPRAIVRANLAFRAVAVAPGERLVEFRYEPLSVRIGALLSAATLLLLLVACGRSRTRRAHQAQQAPRAPRE